MSEDLERARALLAGGRLGAPLHVLSRTSSTNDDAKAGAKAGAPHGAVWIAEEQSAGRGRQGRTWSAARGESLLFSVLLRLACPPARVPLVSLVAGLAVRDAVANALDPSPRAGTKDAEVLVKWPNDVVLRTAAGDRKIAGVLVESSLMGAKVEHVVVGIGLNVHTRDFSPEIAEIATSIALAGGDPDRARILADVLAGLDRDVERVVHRGLRDLREHGLRDLRERVPCDSHGLVTVHERLVAADALRGRRVEALDGSVAGEGAGIDLDGRLLVRRADGGVAKIAAGEVRLRPVGS